MPAQPRPGDFKKGHAKLGGRPKGQGNLISADTRREILAGIAAHGSDDKGTGGIAGAVYAACAANLRNAVSLLCAITPKMLEANITKTEVRFTTIAELDADLRAHGLPESKEIFAISYKDSGSSDGEDRSVPEAEEAEIVPPEPSS